MNSKEYFKTELKEIAIALEMSNIRPDVMYKYIDQYADLKAKEACVGVLRFLHPVIGESLSDDELGEIYERWKESKEKNNG